MGSAGSAGAGTGAGPGEPAGAAVSVCVLAASLDALGFVSLDFDSPTSFAFTSEEHPRLFFRLPRALEDRC